MPGRPERRHPRELCRTGRRPAVDRRVGDPVGHDGRGALLLRPPRARDPGRVRAGRGAPRAMTFDAVLWDYGGIFTASPFAAAHAYARSQDVEPEEMLRVVFGSYDADTDHVWHQLERGEMSFVDALNAIKADAEA